MKKITVIEPTINDLTRKPLFDVQKRRVAAYARVSTDNPEQEDSYETQVNHYKKYISDREDWELVDIYADEGISGTSTKKRKEFNRMIQDAVDGKIDLIICKSISRFARNTLDTISKVRELKAIDVEVFFEKENLSSFDSKSEFVTTIMASMAQEESRSISENVKWGKRARFQNGEVSIPYGSFLGYKKGPNGEIAIDEEESAVVQKIYELFLYKGYTSTSIAKYLNDHHVPTVRKKEGGRWQKSVVDSILRNEKYKGDALLQKGYVKDFLDHKVVKNNGELPQYYVQNSHKPIIEPEEWEMVQLELKRREKLGHSYSCTDPFGSRLICEDCGGIFGRKVWHSTDQYKTAIYQCNRKFDKGCKTPHLTEDAVKEAFLKAYLELIANRDEIITNLETVVLSALSTDEIEVKIEELKIELDMVNEKVESLISDKGKNGEIDEDAFNKRYSALESRFNKTKNEMNELIELVSDKKRRSIKVNAYIKYLKEQPEQLPAWGKRIWMVLVEQAIVHRDKTITFKFFDGMEIRV